MPQQGSLNNFHISGISSDRQPRSIEALFKLLSEAQHNQRRAMCVIENVSETIKNELIQRFAIDSAFFDSHYKVPGCSATNIWQRKSWHNPLQSPLDSVSPWQQLIGLFEYYDPDIKKSELDRLRPLHLDRHVLENEEHPISASTVITYLKVSPYLYVFLVDSPIESPRRQTGLMGAKATYRQHTLRFPYAGNRGGLYMPRLTDQQAFSPLQILANAFEHQWQIDLIFNTSYTFPNVPFLYVLSNSAWATRFRRLDKRIKDVCLRKIRDTSNGLEIVNSLHDLREDLSNLRFFIEETIFYTADNAQDFFSELKRRDSTINMRRTPVEGHSSIKADADQLHIFFMENIQLLLGIISIQDAQHSIQQTHKSTILTALATIYLPLSLATSIFGMNLQEMNGSGPKIWIFAVVCAVILILTSAAVLLVFKQSILGTIPLERTKKMPLPKAIESV